jgi:hypothetical protein
MLCGCLSGLLRTFFGACSTLVRHFFDPIDSEKCRTRVEQREKKVRTCPEEGTKSTRGEIAGKLEHCHFLIVFTDFIDKL